MNVAKVTISIEAHLLDKLDDLVRRRKFPNRSQAIQSAVEEHVTRSEKNRLKRECAKLDKREERASADLGLAADFETWPEY
jgi:metal-responsive CopG/Arc/MetJ family transcriptional regulator